MITAVEKKVYDVLSLGAGVQSTVMLLMACKGELPKPDAVVFSDTGWEPENVYAHLRELKAYAESCGIKVDIVSNGNIKQDVIDGVMLGTRFVALPFFTYGTYPIFDDEEEVDENQVNMMDVGLDVEEKKDRVVRGYEKRKGMVRRQCTADYKIKPVNKYLRGFLGMEKGERVRNTTVRKWMGITTDEITRVKPAHEGWIEHHYPLIDMNMSRADCIAYLRKNWVKPVPKSSCIGCPFHDNKMWLDIKNNDPVSWKDAVEVDKLIRKLPRFDGAAFLHRSCKPLEEVDFGDGQQELFLDGFDNECTGHCGV